MVTIPQSEEVLEVHLEGYSHCFYTDEVCQRCEVTIKFYVRDLTEGRVPIANIALNMNGEPLVNQEDISAEYYEDTIYLDAGCGQDIHLELMATNWLGHEAYTSIFGNTTEGELVE